MVFNRENEEYNVANIFSDRKPNIKRLIHTAKLPSGDTIDNLYIIPSSIKLSRIVENAITRTHRERILEKAIKDIKYDFDKFVQVPSHLKSEDIPVVLCLLELTSLGDNGEPPLVIVQFSSGLSAVIVSDFST